MAMAKEELLEAIGAMSVLELNDLVKAFEDKFGVSAAAFAVAGPAAGPAEAVEEKTEFDLFLTGAGANKVAVIKEVRAIVGPSMSLIDAKKAVESPAGPLLQGVTKAAAEEAKKKLEAAGAQVEIK